MFQKFKETKMTKTQQRMWNILEFLIRLIILSIPLYLVIAMSVDISHLQNTVASQSASALRGLGYNVFQDGFHIIVGTVQDNFYFMINEDCTAWKSMLFLFALMFAVPGITLKRRLIGLVIGLPVIWIGNLIRVVGVVVVERAWGMDIALILHDYVYRLGLVALVLVIWITWLKLSREKKENVWGKLSSLIRLRIK
jgi:exosortase/archaeosortase family protein